MSFNIVTYLNSLPSDTTYINVCDRNLTHLPDLSRFTELIFLNCSHNELTELPPLNYKLKQLLCGYNKLTTLPPLNNNLERLSCCNNLLKILPPLNDNLTLLFCYGNELTYLPQLNDKLIQLNCEENYLTKLPPLNNNLKHLNCGFNLLRTLPQLNDNITTIYCDHNNLNTLPLLNNKLEIFVCRRNNLDYIPCLNRTSFSGFAYSALNRSNFINAFRNENNILYNFRYTYYAVKFKKQFKMWLWEKVREPKIMAMYHPSHLNKLEVTDDLEVFLDNWINK